MRSRPGSDAGSYKYQQIQLLPIYMHNCTEIATTTWQITNFTNWGESFALPTTTKDQSAHWAEWGEFAVPVVGLFTRHRATGRVLIWRPFRGCKAPHKRRWQWRQIQCTAWRCSPRFYSTDIHVTVIGPTDPTCSWRLVDEPRDRPTVKLCSVARCSMQLSNSIACDTAHMQPTTAVIRWRFKIVTNNFKNRSLIYLYSINLTGNMIELPVNQPILNQSTNMLLVTS